MSDRYDELREQGRTFLKEEKYEDALNIFKEMMDIDPQNPESHSRLGWVYYSLKKHEDALTVFINALSKFKEDKEWSENFYNGLGWVNYSMDNIDQAIDNFDKVLELNTENPYALEGLKLAKQTQEIKRKQRLYLID